MAKKVFVSGCYDMLHSGHVAFFEEAASYGDLYVGLGSGKTIWELKNRKPVNSDAERLYMVKSIRYVKDAWINSGSGIMDFEKEVIALKPDIFFVNSDGFTPAKKQFCEKHGIQLIVSTRKPAEGLPVRSTTSIRQECRFPYRVEICGGWMDQWFVNKILPGAVITLQIEPTVEFNDRSGMATSSRRKALELWQGQMPLGNREQLARTLFCCENPPGTQYISGAQDQLGLLLPGLNKLNFNDNYWPESIESDTTDETLKFVYDHLFLIPMTPRLPSYDVYAGRCITESGVGKLADSAERAWQAIKNRDVKAWGRATGDCLDAQLEMFPAMQTDELKELCAAFAGKVCGCKLTGAGGGGYMILISEDPVPDALRVIPSAQ
ncbi:MAG: cytidyltransferase [Lentisphaerae bacterium]|nr:cytidyltransferase [Lentisphaerota bacterium]